MSANTNFGDALLTWANRVPSVEGVVLIGSRARGASAKPDRPDELSDWDFHLVVSQPELFFQPDWTKELKDVKLLAYALRITAIGATPKVTAVFDCGEVDLVLVPTQVLRRVRLRSRFGLHRRPGWTRRRMTELSEVLGHGWRFLKDTGRWADFYRRADGSVPYPWLTDAQVRQLAEAFVCEYVSAKSKAARGEFTTAFRTLTLELMETNFKLLHELRGRRGEPTFRQARRIERIGTPQEVAAITVTAVPERGSIDAALDKAAATCGMLMDGLTAGAWRWPEELRGGLLRSAPPEKGTRPDS